MKENRNLLAGIIFGALMVCVIGFMLVRQNKIIEVQKQDQKAKIENQSTLLTSIRMNSYVFLMSNILDRVDDELKDNPKRTLSDGIIGRIAALNHALMPYGYLKEDSVSEKKLSPERGQLLLALSLMDMDSSSFNKIKRLAPFSYADLRGVDLSGANLRGVNLRWANLNEANLAQADLSGADMRDASLWGANLAKANLSEADVQRSDLRWTEMNGADLHKANLSGVDLTSAKLKNANLREVEGMLSNLSGAFLNDADLTGMDLQVSDLRQANFSNANMTGIILERANLTEAVLTGATMSGGNLRIINLTKAEVGDENWLEKVSEWQVVGLKEILEEFKVVKDVSDSSVYRIEKIED